uniref:Uncharacterized protein n=1 Tax=Rhizophora mucronata TaxID=61149 RepID=A0A2P2N5D3_RHIMU
MYFFFLSSFINYQQSKNGMILLGKALLRMQIT